MLEVKLIPKRDNFRFIDPVSGLHLTLLHNQGVVAETTPFIENGIVSRVIEVNDMSQELKSKVVEGQQDEVVAPAKKQKKTK